MKKVSHEYEALRYYFQPGVNISYHGSGKSAQLFADAFAHYSLCSLDAPDFFISTPDIVYIIEHFEFTSYKEGRKGSEYRQEESRIQRETAEIVPSTEEPIVIRDEIRGITSYSNYIENVSKNFSAHYSRVDNYIKNLKQKGILNNQLAKVVFFIEDATPLGNVAEGMAAWDPDLVHVNLAHSREFLDLLRDNPRVDYVLACSCFGSENYIWFIDRDEIDDYYKETIDYMRLSFIPLTTHIISAKMAIADERLEQEFEIAKASTMQYPIADESRR